jgi:hypothetical protein
VADFSFIVLLCPSPVARSRLVRSAKSMPESLHPRLLPDVQQTGVSGLPRPFVAGLKLHIARLILPMLLPGRGASGHGDS